MNQKEESINTFYIFLGMCSENSRTRERGTGGPQRQTKQSQVHMQKIGGNKKTLKTEETKNQKQVEGRQVKSDV